MTMPGMPATSAPMASKEPPETWVAWKRLGIRASMWGSAASSGAEVLLRDGATAQALEAMPPGNPPATAAS